MSMLNCSCYLRCADFKTSGERKKVSQVKIDLHLLYEQKRNFGNKKKLGYD
jgi:hypothetical protein